MKKIKIIGAGGIGGWLLDPLCLYLSYNQENVEVTICDGDVYQDKNKDRQRFTEVKNKAIHTMETLRKNYPKLHFRCKSEYLTEDNVISLIRENDTVFMCVDNHKTRKCVSDRCEELNNIVLISGGNDYTDGSVIVYIRKNGKDFTRPLTHIDPAIANPSDENPGDVDTQRSGCEEDSQSSPQLLFTNLAIASMMCNVYYAVEKEQVNFHQVYIDILKHKMRPSPDIVKF